PLSNVSTLTAPADISTLSLHDALPISLHHRRIYFYADRFYQINQIYQPNRLSGYATIMHMKWFILLLPLVVVLLPVTSLAQDTGLIPCGYGEACNTGHVAQFANTLISYLISILSVLAVIVLVITGFQMVVSAGNSDQWGVLTKR